MRRMDRNGECRLDSARIVYAGVLPQLRRNDDVTAGSAVGVERRVVGLRGGIVCPALSLGSGPNAAARRKLEDALRRGLRPFIGRTRWSGQRDVWRRTVDPPAVPHLSKLLDAAVAAVWIWVHTCRAHESPRRFSAAAALVGASRVHPREQRRIRRLESDLPRDHARARFDPPPRNGSRGRGVGGATQSTTVASEEWLRCLVGCS
jgi:hypothetical protein